MARRSPRNRRNDYTRASEVAVIDATTGEVVRREQPLGEMAHERVVSRGNRRADPSRRATARRNFSEEA